MNTPSYEFSAKYGIININKSALVALKEEKTKNLCTLIGKAILGGVMVIEFAIINLTLILRKFLK